MMHEFLSNNSTELAARCRIKVGQRPGRSATDAQLKDGIPLFLDQLIRTLQIEQTENPMDSRHVSGPSGGGAAYSEVSAAAARHGKDLLALGLTVDQVVHDYGDLCQSITDLAVEREMAFQVDEFRTLHRCLDNAISDAVTEFSFQRDAQGSVAHAHASGLKLSAIMHEMRALLGTACLAFSASKTGQLTLAGATGSILERSLRGLEQLIAAALQEARDAAQERATLAAFSLADFIAEIYAAASVSARMQGCTLRAPQVDPELALSGTRDLLLHAVANLVHNAFKFSKPGTEVHLTAYAVGESIHIDVADHCGGLAPGAADRMFLPVSQFGTQQTGIGLGLTIAKQSVVHNGGALTVQNVPGHGCVFTVELPRHRLPD